MITHTPCRFIMIVLLICMISSCTDQSLTQKESAAVTDSVSQLAQTIAKDISHDGPAAWLKYFETNPNFFMASDGQLVFANNDSATNFIKNVLVKNITKIELQWKDIRIDPLTQNFADMAATFHEDITDITGKTMPYDGYFTAIAERGTQGWQLRNAHWSIKK